MEWDLSLDDLALSMSSSIDNGLRNVKFRRQRRGGRSLFAHLEQFRRSRSQHKPLPVFPYPRFPYRPINFTKGQYLGMQRCNDVYTIWIVREFQRRKLEVQDWRFAPQ